MTPDAEVAAVGRLVDAMLICTAPISQLLDHMLRSPSAPTPAQAAHSLRGLLVETLAPHVGALAAGDVDGAAQLVARAARVIRAELYVVPHDAGAVRSSRPRRPTCG